MRHYSGDIGQALVHLFPDVEFDVGKFRETSSITVEIINMTENMQVRIGTTLTTGKSFTKNSPKRKGLIRSFRKIGTTSRDMLCCLNK